MNFTRHCFLCLVGVLVLETVFVHAVDLKPAIKATLGATSDSEHHQKPHPLLDNYSTGKESVTRRKLLAPTSNDVCKWDANAQRYRRDLLGVSRVMSTSKDTFVKYLSNYPLCIGTEDKESCVARDQCFWRSTSGRCGFSNKAYGNKNSPCVKAAQATFDEYEANSICQQKTSSSSCKASKNCQWTEDSACYADYIKIHFGVSREAFFAEHDKISDIKIDELVDLLFEDFDVQAADFDWSTVLDWDVPDTSCPRGATPTVCKYSNARAKVFVPVTSYCGQTYESQPSSCNKDPRCSYISTLDSCGPSSSQTRLAHARGIIAAAEDIPRKVDGDLLTALYNCTTLRKQSECEGDCRWIASTGTCEISRTYEGSILAAPGVENPQARADPVCLLYEHFAASECEETKTRSLCESKRLCDWTSGIGCVTSSLRVATAALSSTTDTSVTLETVFPDCTAITSKGPEPSSQNTTTTNSRRSNSRRSNSLVKNSSDENL